MRLRCPRGYWPGRFAHDETAAGQVFACYDCAEKACGKCAGYKSPEPPQVTHENEILSFFRRLGLTQEEEVLSLAYCKTWSYASLFSFRNIKGAA